tara:strand:- start:3170 stop:3535 length:366 start_codon:yes stop_codon:yes gene_type:complete
MEENEQQPGKWKLLIVPLFGLAMAGLINVKNEQTNNFFRNPAKSVERKSIAPIFNDEMERRVIKAELGRPTGTEPAFQPVRVIYVDKAELENPCLAGDCGGEVSPVYSSALDAIIIKEVLQ